MSNAALTTVAATTKVLLGGFSPGTAGIDETILRNRGVYTISGSSPEIGDRSLIGAIGMCLVSDAAVAAGVASMPGPVTDAADDLWFAWQSFCIQTTTAGTAATVVQSIPMQFDSKAKRILSRGRQVALIIENEHASFTFDVLFSIRSLAQVRGTR